MQRGKEIPSKPRFGYVTRVAYDLLLECGCSTFPISPYDVLDKLDDIIECLKWSDARIIMQTEDPFHLVQHHIDGRTIRRRDYEKALIIYDDIHIQPDERITWTLMHEIGHVLLGHLTDFNITELSRGGISYREYNILEVEANQFAAEVLMPLVIIRHISELDAARLYLLCGVSRTAARKRYDSFKKIYDYHEDAQGIKVIRNFFKFMNEQYGDVVYSNIYDCLCDPKDNKYVPICRKCSNCYSYIFDAHAKYCPYCGTKIEQPTFPNTWDGYEAKSRFIRHPGITHYRYLEVRNMVKPNGSVHEQATICPTCLNNSISQTARFCPICGTPIINWDIDGTDIRSLSTCFNTNTGETTVSRSWYPQIEDRHTKIISYRGRLINEDWIEYPYWEFAKFLISANKDDVGMDLRSALIFSIAYVDDDDNLHVITDTAVAAKIINDNPEYLLEKWLFINTCG